MEATRLHAPPILARGAKRAAAQVRHGIRLRSCRRGYARYGDRYPNEILFVAGLPKSGTTWLEGMLASYPGYSLLLPPSITRYEMEHGRSHDYTLPGDFFSDYDRVLAVTKTHVPGSPRNVDLLRRHELPHVVLYRDLRDVAVSHYFYVRNTRWHPEHPHYQGLDPEGGLRVFLDRELDSFAAWIRSWESHRDPELTCVIRYEEMVRETMAVLRRVADHLGLDGSDETLLAIVKRHSFDHLTGRENSEADGTSFFRRGTPGDWRNHFTPELEADYREALDGLLEELGYPAWES